jgi:hypothetical protein
MLGGGMGIGRKLQDRSMDQLASVHQSAGGCVFRNEGKTRDSPAGGGKVYKWKARGRAGESHPTFKVMAIATLSLSNAEGPKERPDLTPG